jgi:hypothetical protein
MDVCGGGAGGFRKSGVADVNDAPIVVVGFAIIHAHRYHRRQHHQHTREEEEEEEEEE